MLAMKGIRADCKDGPPLPQPERSGGYASLRLTGESEEAAEAVSRKTPVLKQVRETTDHGGLTHVIAPRPEGAVGTARAESG